ncbi:MAG: hypothetical protein J07HQW1_01851 [Haloquadratum walsbyi J07HQW1]|jgi:hypothetical protein|uniref:Uncharacterized protein n=1 Tax=Haloquadratum walsbyi J07HQW1 TaxID=1238424 RepID=U1PDZ7_9EURY|nr:MAG: hypothetical protein J07HQW1_01851 [Haloquadratum walsbyi J07HQW1]
MFFLVGETDMEAICGHIRDVTSGGGTNMNAGLETAIDLLSEHEEADATQLNNWVVFLTNMMSSDIDRNITIITVEQTAERGIHTTSIGCGWARALMWRNHSRRSGEQTT